MRRSRGERFSSGWEADSMPNSLSSGFRQSGTTFLLKFGFRGITEQVVAVEFDERIKIQERLEARSSHTLKETKFDPSGLPPSPASEHCQSQRNSSKYGRRNLPKDVLISREEPSVADIAVKRGLQKHQHETHLGEPRHRSGCKSSPWPIRAPR